MVDKQKTGVEPVLQREKTISNDAVPGTSDSSLQRIKNESRDQFRIKIRTLGRHTVAQ